MYHLCEVLDCDLYLSELEWHRLDNVFVISGMGIFFLHLSGNSHCRLLVYSTLMISILAQEKDPWNLKFTIAPIVLFGVMSLIARLWYFRSYEVTYNWRYLLYTAIFMGIGSQFFFKGLD